jgi:hypothetical protein
LAENYLSGALLNVEDTATFKKKTEERGNNSALFSLQTLNRKPYKYLINDNCEGQGVMKEKYRVL